MTTFPPSINPAEGERLTEVVKDWAAANGLVVRPPPAVVSAEADPQGILATPVPVTLFPSPFPKVCFDQGVSVQQAYNELYAAISQDEEFLAQTVKEIGDSDDFITELWKVHLRVKAEGYVQHKSLGLFRSDYMVHQDTPDSSPSIKQVEFNTIASSFGGLSAQTCLLHRYLASTEYPLLENEIPLGKLDLPRNASVAGLAGGIRQAFIEYGAPTTSHPKCVIFLVQGGERNIFDQKHLEFELQKSEQPQVPVFRLPYAEILQHTRIADGAGRELLYTPPKYPGRTFEVAVIYMRSGYGPGDYPDQSAWEARYHLERSAAIKCPSVLTQVAGTKKVQQVLATPETPSNPSILTKFLATGATSTTKLAATFTNIYPLDGSEAGLKARQIAQDPELCKKYVLKPQREGGGNNIYRSAIPEFLKTIPEAHYTSYILMELITPPPVTNTILRNGKLEHGGVICELGIYGTCLWDGQSGKVLHNEQAGYLLRTKGDKSEEGGVAAGFGCMDSCSLV
ncbi:glutathione synthetase-like protein [Microdochium trichocladiopsis]|uniref:Glutathione synthetase n=1 Tax=Microdochium trichocladiopsis TaxID=1682393 RepID=A0A9P9BST3_9PEZI|nr:glutathione synthetase-like protein [Microdochium trichocladiopsis]KAH7038215.1 glutathione synthetase-like protein [Microdochium trichocladiopsis]